MNAPSPDPTVVLPRPAVPVDPQVFGRPIVLKFGGSSVADADRMRQVADRVCAVLPTPALVVLSATAGTTDALLDLARAAANGDAARAHALRDAIVARHRTLDACLQDESNPLLEAALASLDRSVDAALTRALPPLAQADALAAHGERLSTACFTALLRKRGVATTPIDARELVTTDDAFGNARPDRAMLARRAVERLAAPLTNGEVLVTEGFVGATADGRTTTLGRGGSDYSAALFGAALGAREVQIWTDVEGVHSADPRVVPDARPIELLSFAEAAELAAFGAKVLHPATIQPAVEANVPVTVRHTLRPDGRFTTITGRIAEQRAVTAVASRSPITVLTITSSRMLAQAGFLARLFDVFARHRVSVDVVATAEVAVSLTVDADVGIEALARELAEFAHVQVVRDRALVALIGERLRRSRTVAPRVLESLADVDVELLTFGANDSNLSLIVPRAVEHHVVRRLHASFFETPALAGRRDR